VAALTLQNIRDQVRNTVELDSTDIPDSIIDLFVQEGFDRIARDQRRWSFYEDDYSFTTVEGQQAYPFSSIGSTLVTVDGVEHPSWMCLPIGHQLAQGQYAGSTVLGTPTNFSVWADKVYLWPTPGAEIAVTVRGYRAPTDWIAQGSGATPDLPVEFHPLLVLWALHRAYMQQDDAQMGQMLRQMFNEQFRILRDAYTRPLDAEPSVIGATHAAAYSMLPPRLRYTFDY
jgi:hypothetical protein